MVVSLVVISAATPTAHGAPAPDVAERTDRPRTARTVSAVRKWARLARGRFARVARRGGNIRPATYPIREFLAWRR